MIKMDIYKPGAGVIKVFKPVTTEKEAIEFLNTYCKENNVTIKAKETCDTAVWNYLSDGTEFDYCRTD